MSDAEWLKQLMKASVQGGRLVSSSPESVRALAEQRVAAVMTGLLAEAEDACSIFNDLKLEASAKRTSALSRIAGSVKVLVLSGKGVSLAGDTADAPRGLVFLWGHCQVTLEQKGACLEATAASVVQYQKSSRHLYSFKPQFDAFGTLVWACSGMPGLLMTEEMIVKKVLEDLLLTVFNSES